MLDNVIGLITGFFEVLECFAAQGPTFQEALLALIVLLVILVVTFLVLWHVGPFLVGTVAATLFGVSGGLALSVGTILIDVLIGLLIVRGSTTVMQGVTGCRPRLLDAMMKEEAWRLRARVESFGANSQSQPSFSSLVNCVARSL